MEVRTTGVAALFAALLSTVCAAEGAGQVGGDPGSVARVQLAGTVVDRQSGAEVPAVSISLHSSANGDSRVVWQGTSDRNGAFRAPDIPAGMYELRASALGYADLAENVAVIGASEVNVRVEMVPDALVMDPLVVTTIRPTRLERSGFYERQRLGTGHTRTREEIEARNPIRPSDIFRTIPGVQVAYRGGGLGNQLHFRGGCRAEVVIDGITVRGDFTIDELLTVEDIEAVEVYSAAATPARFSRIDRTTCGTVLAWTRDGSGTKGEPMTLRRVLTAGALVGAIFLFGGI